MNQIDRAAFIAHADTRQYQARLVKMHALIKSIDPEKSYVSLSWGKDSSVIAHAAQSIHTGIAMLMVDPGCPTHWTEEERDQCQAYAKDQGWNVKTFNWDKWGTDRKSDDVERYQAKIHEDMFADLHAYANQQGLSIRLMGLRAAESRKRRMSIGKRGDNYQLANGDKVVLPIATWQTADVWAYILTNKLPWLDIYNKLGPAARNGLIGRSGEEFGRIEYLKHHYPDVWRWAISRGIL